MGCMSKIVEYMTYHEMLKLQACGKKLYNDIVPKIMMKRELLPQIGIYQFLNGAEYEPQVIYDALLQESSKFFVPTRWPNIADWQKYSFNLQSSNR